ncbi:DUF6378 domain-containing protein [Agathobaculum sp.]|jgi:hypothetical protein|uniref:DUF6378 domain-containing protein n=1 Tax=Agathobaculum sp. TaxID=2048138 RepID=UPI00307C63FE
MTIEEMNRAMLVYTAMHELQRALLLGGSALREREKELIEAVSVWLDGRRREDAAQETPDRKEGETMTQKEKYRRTREAMRMALRHIDAAAPDIEDCLREVVDAVSAELPKIKGAAETADKKGWTEMTQEKYKKVAAAMRTALVSIFGNYADVEDRLRTADAEIQSVLLNERICARPASYPIEGIAVEAEKLETENEPDEGEGEAKKLTRAAVLEKARACVCGEREQDYGSPEDSFGCIAELWEAYLRAACIAPDAVIRVTPTDVAMMMALLKIARVGTSFVGGTADSFVDLAGYAACGAECAEVTV